MVTGPATVVVEATVVVPGVGASGITGVGVGASGMMGVVVGAKVVGA